MPTLSQALALTFAFVSIASAIPAETELARVLDRRDSCNATPCTRCREFTCGLCDVGGTRCRPMALCNSRFTNCKRSVEYDLALAAGKIRERDDGSVEVLDEKANEWTTSVMSFVRNK
ncbi:hypothetical protein DM02DRAFT_658814 [Periconia macrospinosa]|uniref:PSI domain-containing protein n=1 Tax=Periconia macrospinosa TaxID=97972 RepID=A0A2V1DIF3_9PLEO|nr:hypothetical protein DM02DRAFT_658814 [Periconia macrospinosa]